MAGIDIRLPNINGATEREKIEEIQKYLAYLAGQLEYALKHIDDTNMTETFSRKVTDAVTGAESVYQQMADGFSQYVKKGNIVSAINQSAEKVNIDASKVSLEGYTTINGAFAIDEFGNVKISGGGDIELVSEGSNLALFNIKSADGKKTVRVSPNEIRLIGTDGGSIRIVNVFDNVPGITVSGEYGTVEIGGVDGVISPQTHANTEDSAGNVVVDAAGRLRRQAPSTAETTMNVSETLGADTDPTKLYNLPIKEFEHITGWGGTRAGILVEDMVEAYPAAVDFTEEGEPIDWSYKKLIPAMLKLIQEQNARIAALE